MNVDILPKLRKETYEKLMRLGFKTNPDVRLREVNYEILKDEYEITYSNDNHHEGFGISFIKKISLGGSYITIDTHNVEISIYHCGYVYELYPIQINICLLPCMNVDEKDKKDDEYLNIILDNIMKNKEENIKNFLEAVSSITLEKIKNEELLNEYNNKISSINKKIKPLIEQIENIEYEKKLIMNRMNMI
jgi:hypothetical protein